MRGVLYVSHGSRVPEAIAEATSFIEKVQHKIATPLQEICFLELAAPTISEGFQKLVDQGATEIAVIPVLLLSAGHYYKDIPAEIETMQQRYPRVRVSYGQPLGVQERLTRILQQRIQETGVTPNEDAQFLVVGRGSYNPQTQKDVEAIATTLRSLTRFKHIDVCYLAACEPSFETAVQEAIQRAHSQIFIVPYLWFTGILNRHIAQAVKDAGVESNIILCQHLGHHPAMVEALRDRVLEALAFHEVEVNV